MHPALGEDQLTFASKFPACDDQAASIHTSGTEVSQIQLLHRANPNPYLLTEGIEGLLFPPLNPNVS